jgi:predicted RNase H-like nuclease (RuvC/YqgF family)
MAGSSGGNVPANDRKGHQMRSSTHTEDDRMSHEDAAEKKALQHLDNEYTKLDSCEAILLATLQRLKSEEEALVNALETAGETLDKKRARERKAQQDEAARRLESALLAPTETSGSFIK